MKISIIRILVSLALCLAMTAQQSREILMRMGVSEALQHHLSIEQAMADVPLVAGNTTHILHDGEKTFRAMFSVIESARRYIHLEYYIMEDVESGGAKLSALLMKKSREVVAVNIIYDLRLQGKMREEQPDIARQRDVIDQPLRSMPEIQSLMRQIRFCQEGITLTLKEGHLRQQAVFAVFSGDILHRIGIIDQVAYLVEVTGIPRAAVNLNKTA